MNATQCHEFLISIELSSQKGLEALATLLLSAISPKIAMLATKHSYFVDKTPPPLPEDDEGCEIDHELVCETRPERVTIPELHIEPRQ